MATLKVGIEITAKALGSVRGAFGSTQRTVESLGKSIDKATRYQERLGRVMGAAMMTSTRGLGNMPRRYHDITRAIDGTIRAQTRLNKAMASYKAGAEHRKQLRGEMLETTGHAAVVGLPVISSIKTFMRQEDAATELKIAMMKASGEIGAFNDILKEARSLGKDLPGTTEDFTRLGLALKEQGVTDARLKNGALRTSAKLNIVMGMDQYEGGTFFAKMLEAHGLDESEFAKAADITQRSKNSFGLDKQDMFYAMKYSAPMIRKMGLTGIDNYEKIMAVEGMAAQIGNEGSTFGTNFSGLLGRFASGPVLLEMAKKGIKGEARDILDKAGVKFNFFDKKGNFKGIEAMIKELEKLEDIKKRFGQNSAEIVSKAIFGEEAGRLAEILGSGGLKGFERNLNLMREQADLEARIAVKTSTLSSALEQLGGVAENTIGTLGGVFKDDIVKFSNTAQDFIEKTLDPWLSRNKLLVLGTVKFVGALFALKLGVLGVTYACSALASPFKWLWLGFARLNALSKMFNLWRLTGGFGKLAKGVSIAGKALLGVGRMGVWAAITKGFGMAANAVMVFGRALLFNPIGLIVAGIAGAAFLIYKYWKPIKGFFIGMWEGITDAFTPVLPAFNGLLDAMKPVISVFKSLFSAEQAAEGVARSFGYTFGQTIGYVLTSVFNTGTMIINGWRMIFDGLFSIAGNAWTEIKTAWNGGLTGILGLILNWSPLGAFYSALSSTLSWFGVTLPAQFTGFGRMLIEGLARGIRSAWAGAQAALTAIAANVKSTFKSALGIHSPSRVFMGYGSHIIDGLAIGLSRNAPKAEKTLQSLSDRLGVDPKTGAALVPGATNTGATGGINIVVHFNPTINGGGDPASVKESLKLSLEELQRMLRQLDYDQYRRSFSS